MLKNLFRLSGRVTLLSALWLVAPPSRSETFDTLTGALDSITEKFQVKAGLEYVTGDPDNQPFSIDLNLKSVDLVLDRLVTEKPLYAWAVRDGVYDIYPKNNANSFLDVKVGTFAVHKVSLARASEEITRVREVSEWLAKERVRRRKLEVGGPNNVMSATVTSLTLKEVTLRAVLNSLIKAYKCDHWVFVRYGEAGQFVAIYFR